MDKLPVEVLHRLFTLLSLSQRVTCTLVCRLWWQTLDNRSLLYNIDIDNEIVYGDFIDMIERLPYRSKQVEELTLDHCLESDFDKRKLCNMFPNARKIRLINKNGMATRDFSSNRFHCTNSKPKIEELAEYGSCELASFLISMNLSTHIRILELDLGEKYRKRVTNVILQLKNMPVLEKLKLENFIYGLEDFEKLHENIPTIKTLELINVRIQTVQVPDNIKPATSVTHLGLNIREINNESCSAWLQYLSKKYDHLNQLFIYNFDTHHLGGDFIESTLKSGLVRLLQVNAPYLQTLYWNNLPFHLTIPEELDNIGCKLENLEIRSNRTSTSEFEKITTSKQAKYIKSLSLANITINKTELLKNMEKLTSLSLNCQQIRDSDEDSFIDSDSDSDEEDDNTERDVLNLSDLLEACPPTLTMLSMKKFDFKFNISTNYATFITSLIIESPTIRKKLTDTISTCFPKLTLLKLYGDILDDLTIKLMDNSSVQVYLITNHRKNLYDLSIVAPERKTTHFYTLKSDYPYRSDFEKETVSPTPYGELDGRPIMTFISNSIYKLKYNNCFVNLTG